MGRRVGAGHRRRRVYQPEYVAGLATEGYQDASPRRYTGRWPIGLRVLIEGVLMPADLALEPALVPTIMIHGSGGSSAGGDGDRQETRMAKQGETPPDGAWAPSVGVSMRLP